MAIYILSWKFGFSAYKGEFRDVLCVWYGWNLPNVLSSYNCALSFYVDHAITCNLGGFSTLAIIQYEIAEW